jgi:hypothetical protein
MVYENRSFRLGQDMIVEGDRVAHVSNRAHLINCNKELVRPQLRGTYPVYSSTIPMADALYQVALNDLEMNVVDGSYFRVSPDFADMVFTRDTAYSSTLGAAFVMPDLVVKHLDHTRVLRRKLGFKLSEELDIPIPGLPLEREPLNNLQFFLKYGTHSYGRRTDDICWVLGYWDAACVLQDTALLERMVQEFDYFDEHFYRPFFDEADGLYWGQASFIDVGGSGYPAGFTHADAIMIKALSTNCAYVGAFDRVGWALGILGRDAQAAAIHARANELRQSIRRELRHPDGYYAYFKHRDGRLEQRREQLGMAFLVLYDVVEPDEYAVALGNYPSNDFGSPLFWPFYQSNSKMYHNNALWPFADTFFNLARLKWGQSVVGPHHLNSVDPCHATVVALESFAKLSRHALWGSFNEVIDYETGGWIEKHARSYIWSAAAYLGVVFRMIYGLQFDKAMRLHIQPAVPAALGGNHAIRGLRVGAATVSIELRGTGSRIQRCTADGTDADHAVVTAVEGTHAIRIDLS